MGGEEVAAGADGRGQQEGLGPIAQFGGKGGGNGAITRTVAALLRKGVTAIAATMMSARAPQPDRVLAVMESQPAMISVPTVVRSESATGIRQASITRMGASSWE